jgi:two-component system, LytTR family, response regulator LytT
LNGASPPLRTLVVEDEWPARNYLVELLQASRLAEVVGAVPTVEQAREAIDENSAGTLVEAVFVDVQLLGEGQSETGIDLVRSLVGGVGAPMFVLATAFDRHAIEAFELGVVDYLLKPFTEDRVTQALRRLHERRPATAPTTLATTSRIVARKKRSLVFLELHEIWAFETEDRLTSVHTAHGTFDLDLSLAAIEASFGRTFIRVHRKWLVNASHIKELERDGDETRLFVGPELGDDTRGVKVPVARERAVAVRNALLSNATGLRRS